MAKGIHLLGKKSIFVYTGKKIMQVRAFERYISFISTMADITVSGIVVLIYEATFILTLCLQEFSAGVIL